MLAIVIPKDIEYKQHLDFCDSLTDKCPSYRVKARKLINGAVDFLMMPVTFSPKKDGDFPPIELSDEELEAKRQENIIRAGRRANQVVHYAVRQIQADHMLTLTTRENITDRKEFYAVYSKFVRLVRTKDLVFDGGKLKLISRSTARNWAYVAVTELQERGAFHMHVACVGRQDLSLLRACWYLALGGEIDDHGEAVKGAIDVQSHKRRFSGTTEFFKTFKLVGYLTKYITKSFELDSQLGLKRYSSSRGIPKPEVEYIYLTFMADLVGDLPDDAEVMFGTNYRFPAAVSALYEYAIKRGFTEFSPWNRKHEVFCLRASL